MSIFLYLFACCLFISYGAGDDTLLPYGLNGIITWTEPNCQGIAASTIFNATTLARNISNACISHSFQLLRPLQDQEQLDISIAREPGLRSPKRSQSCSSFIQSYFPINGSKGCHNTPPFACHRLWVNYGLDTRLRGSSSSKSWILPSTLPTIIPSACSHPSPTINTHQLPSSSVLSLSSSPSPVPSSIASRSTWTVQIQDASPTLFKPFSIIAPPGDVIKFQSNKPIQFKKSSPNGLSCVTARDPFGLGTELYYEISSTDPVWFIACNPTVDWCDVLPWLHFALNPGDWAATFRNELEKGFIDPLAFLDVVTRVCLFVSPLTNIQPASLPPQR